jgi:hypothetical protein
VKTKAWAQRPVSAAYEELTIVVIFTDEDDGEAPKAGHVEGFEDLSLVGCSISIPAQVQQLKCQIKLAWCLRWTLTKKHTVQSLDPCHRTIIALSSDMLQQPLW